MSKELGVACPLGRRGNPAAPADLFDMLADCLSGMTVLLPPLIPPLLLPLLRILFPALDPPCSRLSRVSCLRHSVSLYVHVSFPSLLTASPQLHIKSQRYKSAPPLVAPRCGRAAGPSAVSSTAAAAPSPLLLRPLLLFLARPRLLLPQQATLQRQILPWRQRLRRLRRRRGC